MVQYTPMPAALRKEILDRYPPTDDPEIQARRRDIAMTFVRLDPGLREELREELTGEVARILLLRALSRRGFSLGPDDRARIDACEDVATLERWIEQAVTAASLAEALA
jgi:hypothetical protein